MLTELQIDNLAANYEQNYFGSKDVINKTRNISCEDGYYFTDKNWSKVVECRQTEAIGVWIDKDSETQVQNNIKCMGIKCIRDVPLKYLNRRFKKLHSFRNLREMER